MCNLTSCVFVLLSSLPLFVHTLNTFDETPTETFEKMKTV